jgi:hypothetical protein
LRTAVVGEADAMLPSLPLSQVGRTAHDIGLAGMLGGNLFGRLALHPSVTAISDRRERGAVENAAWSRYGVIQSLGLAAVVSGWAAARAAEAADRRLSPRERRLARAKDALVGAVAVTGIATAVTGIRFSRQEPGGAVPLADGEHTAPEATDREAALKRRVNALGVASIASEAALAAVNAALAQENFRRPSARRIPLRLRG